MKSIRSQWIVLALALSALPTLAQAQLRYWDNGDGTATITGYSGPVGEVTIPSATNGLRVTSIGDYAFLDCTTVTGVTIPTTVTSIGRKAFYYCTSLVGVKIPASVTSLGDNAFEDCFSLADVTIPNSLTNVAGYAFSRCTSLTCITFPNSVTSIGDYAFWSSGLSSVTIPHSVTSIGRAAFALCSGLTSVTIPKSVTSMGSVAFAGCLNLTSVTLEDGVTGVGPAAFFECFNLTSVTIPDSVKRIDNSAFFECTRLTSIRIPNSVTSIEDSAFRQCGLATVTIPESVTSIGTGAFSGCTGLTRVYFVGNAPVVGEGAFSGDNNATVYYLPGTTGWGTTFGGLPAVPLAAPTVTCSVQQPVLWPPNNKLANVGLTVTALDYTSTPIPATIQVFCNQNARDAVNIGADTLQLRADRAGNAKDGRVYLIVANATDSFGNVGFASCTVVVPHDASPRSTTAVNALAADAKAYCDSHDGAQPPGYYLLDNGSTQFCHPPLRHPPGMWRSAWPIMKPNKQR
jgi:hypothetical protein